MSLSSPLPLEGLLVVTIEQAVAAPLCTSRLCAAGARVIKIEREGGDFARAYDTAACGESSYFSWINQGKESIVLDFKTDDDKALLERIIAKADILVQNLSPGALARAGLDPARLQASLPSLITCDISGYGDDESVADLRAYDLLVQAEAGLLEVSGAPDEPGRIGISICDIGAGMTAHAAILEALIARSVSGRGRQLKISLFDVAAEWMTVPFVHQQYGKGAPKRVGLHHPSIAPYGAYSTGDNIRTLISIQNEREWQRLCDSVFASATLSNDSRFVSNNQRVANRVALDEEISRILSPMDAAEFRHKLGQANIAYGAINTTAELVEHRALTTTELTNSQGKTMSLPISPQLKNLQAFAALQSAEKNPQTTKHASRSPACGEHTESVRDEFKQGSSD